MDLDDLLPAYVAGDLDPAETAAVEVRMAADADVRRRVTRLRRLAELLPEADHATVMPPAAVERLDAAVDEALRALPDGPLVTGRSDDAVTALPRRPQPGRPAGAHETTGPAGGAVVDLAAQRARRRGLPTWAGGAAAAAVAAALAITVLPGIEDTDEAFDVAEAPVRESADEAADEAGDDAASGMAAEESTEAASDEATDDAPSADSQDGLAEMATPPDDAADATASVEEEGVGAVAGVARFPLMDTAEALAVASELAALVEERPEVLADVRAEQLVALAESADPVATCAADVLDRVPGAAIGAITDTGPGAFEMTLVDAAGGISTVAVDARCALVEQEVS